MLNGLFIVLPMNIVHVCIYPDSKVHVAHLGPTGPRWAHVGPMHFAIWLGMAYGYWICMYFIQV